MAKTKYDLYRSYAHASGMLGQAYTISEQLTDEEQAELLRQRTKKQLLESMEKWNWDKRFYDNLDPKLQDLLTPEEKAKVKEVKSWRSQRD